jgi:hypothetical protein
MVLPHHCREALSTDSGTAVLSDADMPPRA